MEKPISRLLNAVENLPPEGGRILSSLGDDSICSSLPSSIFQLKEEGAKLGRGLGDGRGCIL